MSTTIDAAEPTTPSESVVGGIHELVGEIRSPYINHDLEPARLKDRKWAMKDIAALWISMSACVPTYMLASSLIAGGMNWWQAVLTIFLGNTIVLLPMVLNAHAGTKYGIPFPVYCRPAFGIVGANVPAVLRALVACGWFGIQAWIGGDAIYRILGIFAPGMKDGAPIPGLGINAVQFVCFMAFWGINMFVIYKGIDSIRVLLNVKAPLLILLGLALLFWAYNSAGGFGQMLDSPSAFAEGQPKAGGFWPYFFPALTGMIGFWATLSLNIPDFSRYAFSQRDQVGRPGARPADHDGSVLLHRGRSHVGHDGDLPPHDLGSNELITTFTNPVLLLVALVALGIATLATNIAANVVSPANDFANLAPKKINFRMGGLITGIVGIVIQPWRLVADPTGYIFTWLVGYSALLGSIGGVLICDYYVLRKTKLDLVKLYEKDGPYWYSGGWNPKAIAALLAGILPNIPGFLAQVAHVDVGEFWVSLYHYAWFVGFGISFGVYAALSGKKAAPATAPA